MPASSVFIASVSAGEIQAGVEITRSQDPARAAQIHQWLDDIVGSHQCLDATADIFREWARLMHGRQDDMIEDCLVAATARIHNMTVATRNVKHFLPLGVSVINPFEFNP